MTRNMLVNILAFVKDHKNLSRSIKIFLQRSLEIFESEFKYMKNVLHRAVNIAKCDLAFRNSKEKIVSQTDGNFLGIIELISQYDSFLAEHLVKYGNLDPGKTF